ncbi:MAG TPA: alpha/beta hydrolase, partial [Acidimicrobiales bacterium]|nr:alpha/beta hydrolase [Acidimicrobiales bacterium]
EQPEIKAMFLDDLIGSSKDGLRAPVYDIILFTRPWGFSVTEISNPVYWWHGDADNIVPLEHAHKLTPMIPTCKLVIRPGESHLGGLGAAEEVLETVLSEWDKPATKSRKRK